MFKSIRRAPEPTKGETELWLKISRLLECPEHQERFVQSILEWGSRRQSQVLLQADFQSRRADEVDRYLSSLEPQQLVSRSEIDDELPQELQECRCPAVDSLFPLGCRQLSLTECFVWLAIVHEALADPGQRPLTPEVAGEGNSSSHLRLRCEVQKESNDTAVMLEIQAVLYRKRTISESELAVLGDAYQQVEKALSHLPKLTGTGAPLTCIDDPRELAKPQTQAGQISEQSPSDGERIDLSRKQQTHRWLADAMLLLNENPDLPDCEIARRVGKHPSILCRSTLYQNAAKVIRSRDPVRGLIDIKNDASSGRRYSTVDAVNDNNPANMGWDEAD